MKAPATQPLRQWLRAFWPAPVPADARERWRVVVGATLGILLTGLLARETGASPWLIAPMGATAVLVFAVPTSPMAQPWPVVAGNALSALVGVACVHALGSGPAPAALAVGLAIGLMLALRCLHPPGGATALMVTLAAVKSPLFALSPVLLNAGLMVLGGMAYNTLTRRPYPHAQAPSHAPDDEDAVLDAVLARYNQVLDIGREDLKALLHDVQWQEQQRRLTRLRCSDIMSREPVSVSHRTPVAEARALLAAHRIKALPVVDTAHSVIGIVTRADLLRGEMLERPGEGPATVGQVMTRQVRVASEQRFLAELIPLFASTGHHHIPIVNAAGRLVGMVTQSDVVAALARPPEKV